VGAPRGCLSRVSNLPAGVKKVNRWAWSSDHPSRLVPVYDVIYIDSEGSESPLARALDRDAAAALARREASERGAGRIVCPDAVRPSNCVCVVPAREPARA